VREVVWKVLEPKPPQFPKGLEFCKDLFKRFLSCSTREKWDYKQDADEMEVTEHGNLIIDGLSREQVKGVLKSKNLHGLSGQGN